MQHQLPLSDPEEFFDEISHQGKTITVGDKVLVHQAGQRIEVVVSGIVKRQNHYWVGYEHNQQFCPWPLVQLKS